MIFNDLIWINGFYFVSLLLIINYLCQFLKTTKFPLRSFGVYSRSAFKPSFCNHESGLLQQGASWQENVLPFAFLYLRQWKIKPKNLTKTPLTAVVSKPCLVWVKRKSTQKLHLRETFSKMITNYFKEIYEQMYGRFSELYSKTEIEKYNLIRVDSTIVARYLRQT